MHDGEELLAATVAQMDDCCWEGVCPAVLKLVGMQQEVSAGLLGIVTAANEALADC